MAILLWHRTPDLLAGFGYNLLIAVLAMLLGTLAGALLGAGRYHRLAVLRLPARWATSVCRNVPSFVLMFYIAFVFPVEIEWGGQIIMVPLWFKVTLSLIIPVMGFASDQMLALLSQRARGQEGAGATFLVSWVQYYLIVLMASATASIIGVDDVVGRANEMIAFVNAPGFLLLTYSYVCLFFFASGLLVTVAARRLEAILE
ncbi:MAG: hypothetical protein HLX50_01950 [Alteromonadaceae bacterium]|nr:hypothetical protein [Alteromonadaceae bacterium]